MSLQEEVKEIQEKVSVLKTKILGLPHWAWGVIIAGLLFVVIWLSWAVFSHRQTSKEGFKEAKNAAAVKNVPTQVVQIKHIVVYDKQKLGDKVKIPPEIAQNPFKEVIAMADIPRAEYGATAMTTIDKESGKASTYVEAKEPPLIALEKSGSVGVRGGVSSKGGYAGEIYVQQNLFSVKGHNVYAYGSVGARQGDTTPELKGMLGVDVFKW